VAKLDRIVIPLRVLLVLLFAGLLVGQIFSIPGEFILEEGGPGEAPPLAWVLTVFAILEVVAVQIVIVCTWRLLTLVRADRIFSAQAFVWVDVIVWTLAGAWLLMAGVFGSIVLIIYLTPELRDPGIPILLFGLTLIGAVIVLVVVVMRALLRQAAELRSDLEAVI
jgi:hypothetical protein